MSNLKDKAKDKLDTAAQVAKQASEKVVDKSKDVAHKAGKALKKGGQRLQDV